MTSAWRVEPPMLSLMTIKSDAEAVQAFGGSAEDDENFEFPALKYGGGIEKSILEMSIGDVVVVGCVVSLSVEVATLF